MMGFFRRFLNKKNVDSYKFCNDYLSREFPTVITESESQVQLELTSDTKIAIQVHVYFIELLNEMLEAVNNISYPFDCYVSTDTDEKRKLIEEQFVPFCNAKNIVVEVIENRGRDVAPFLYQMRPVINRYKYVGHIHTKRSLHTDFGEDWRKYLLKNLMGSPEYVNGIFSLFGESPELGFVMPDVYPVIKEYVKWDGAKSSVEQIIHQMGLEVDLPEEPIFSTGNMFWARTEAILPIFKQNYSMEDFPEEKGQLSLTLAHSIERLWVYLMKAQGYSYKICINAVGKKEKKTKNCKRLLLCAENSMKKNLKKYGDVCLDGGNHITIDLLYKYEQIIFIDDTCIGPFNDLQKIIDNMEKESVDMWSILSKPIYFLCINKSIIESKVFEKQWKEKKDKNLEKFCQKLYAELLKNGFSFKGYVRESDYIDKWISNKRPQIELPYEFFLLGSPFVKKGAFDLLSKLEMDRLNSCLQYMSNEERVE